MKEKKVKNLELLMICPLEEWVAWECKYPKSKQNSKTPDVSILLGFFFISNLDEQLDEC